MYWFALFCLISAYYVGKIIWAIWNETLGKNNVTFQPSYSISESNALLLAKEHGIPTTNRAEIISLMQRTRQGEFETCKHARFDDANSSISVCIKLPKLFLNSPSYSPTEREKLQVEAKALFAKEREAMSSRATWQHCMGTGVEAFMAHDFALARAYYLAAHLIERVISAEEKEWDLGETWEESQLIGNSEERLLKRLRGQVPCSCLDLEDPASEYFFAQRMVPAVAAAAAEHVQRPAPTCHECGKTSVKFACHKCGLVSYCSPKCEKLDAKQHRTHCTRQPTWWGIKEEKGLKS